MSGTQMAQRRFWREVRVHENGGEYEILLDGRRLKTPGKQPFLAPIKAVAEAAADEWRAQEKVIDPATMPMTRAVNSSIDRVAPQRVGVIEAIAAYGAADLLCYRVDEPEELVRRQRAHWDEALEWASAQGAKLRITKGLTHITQPTSALATLRAHVAAFDNLGLTALYDLTTISGSLVLALMCAKGTLPPERAWQAARVDEMYQAEQWGEDEDAAAQAANKYADFLFAAKLLDMIRGVVR